MHLYLLDLIRFLSAFYVVVYHLLFRGVAMGEYNAGLYEPASWAAYGWVGVQVFFVISGFIIFKSSAGKTPKQFVKSRVLRLYPAYWICMLVTLIFVLIAQPSWWNLSGLDVLINFTMIQGFVGVEHVDGVYWTLVYEVVFYFWVLFFLTIRRLLWVSVFLCISTVFYILISFGLVEVPPILQKAFLMKYSCYFLIGLVISQARHWKVWATVPVLLLCFFSAWIEIGSKLMNISERSGVELNQMIPYLTLVSVVVLVYFSSSIMVNMKRFGQFFAAMGAMSYPLYLLHQNIGYVLIEVLFPKLGTLSVSLVIIALIVMVFCISKLIEKPVREFLSDKWNRVAFLGGEGDAARNEPLRNISDGSRIP